MSAVLPTGRGFFQRIILWSYVYSIGALLLVLPALHAVLELTRAQWFWFLGCAGLYTLVISGPQIESVLELPGRIVKSPQADKRVPYPSISPGIARIAEPGGFVVPQRRLVSPEVGHHAAQNAMGVHVIRLESQRLVQFTGRLVQPTQVGEGHGMVRVGEWPRPAR